MSAAPARPVVVLTPVRNEAWILDAFLGVTTQFADRIVVVDQSSTDSSREICAGYEKVIVIENPSPEYDEAARQRLLLRTARELVPQGAVLLALDSDELIAADALGHPAWASMRCAAPGSVLLFHKPDLVAGLKECVCFDAPWPLGYVDDGAAHTGTVIHSLRLPTPEGAARIAVEGVTILHLALVRPLAQRAKYRLYAVTENLRGTTHLLRRRAGYAAARDLAKHGRRCAVPDSWLAGWKGQGLRLTGFPQPEFYWQDFEALRILSRQGARRFWFDDLWAFDWEACRRYGLSTGEPDMPPVPIPTPPAVVRTMARFIDRAYAEWLVWRDRRRSPTMDTR